MKTKILEKIDSLCLDYAKVPIDTSLMDKILIEIQTLFMDHFSDLHKIIETGNFYMEFDYKEGREIHSFEIISIQASNCGDDAIEFPEASWYIIEQNVSKEIEVWNKADAETRHTERCLS